MRIIDKTVEMTIEVGRLTGRKINHKLRHVHQNEHRFSFSDPVQYLLEILGSFLFAFYMMLPVFLGSAEVNLPFISTIYDVFALHAIWLAIGIVFMVTIFQKYGIHASPIGTTLVVKRGGIDLFKAWIIFGFHLIGTALALVTLLELSIHTGTMAEGASTLGAPTAKLWGFWTRSNGYIDLTGQSWFYAIKFFLSVIFIYSLYMAHKAIFKKFNTPLAILATKLFFMWLVIMVAMKFGVHYSTPIRVMAPAIFSLVWGGNFDMIAASVLAASTTTGYILILLTGKDSRVNWKHYFTPKHGVK